MQYGEAKINYSQQHFSSNEVWIQPHTILFEENVQQQQINCTVWNELKIFFQTGGDIPFDMLAASFYLISRYEEYQPWRPDEYGRFSYSSSIAAKENFLQLPLVNLWLQQFEKIIQQKFPSYTCITTSFTFTPTYDIDIAYAYLHKPLVNNIAGFCKELFTGNWQQLKERVNVTFGKAKDPFDTYNFLHQLHEQFQLQPLYFFLLAEKRKGYDKNISPHSKAMQQLIQQHAATNTTGIHPSWQSGDDEKILKKEIQLLENCSGKKVSHSRQHYIRMHLPETYRTLIANGITHDYSMGYGSINGFRASYCLPHYWFDIIRNETTSLIIHPFCYMEANSFFEQHYTAAQAAEELQQYYDTVKKVNGTLITIFHNHFITGQQQWIEWRKMYADFLQKNFG